MMSVLKTEGSKNMLKYAATPAPAPTKLATTFNHSTVFDFLSTVTGVFVLESLTVDGVSVQDRVSVSE